MSIDKEPCEDNVKPKICSESRNTEILVENKDSDMTVAEDEDEISLKSSKLSSTNPLDEENVVENQNNKTVCDHDDRNETLTSQSDQHMELHPVTEKKVETCQITRQCVSVNDSLQKKNSKNENKTFISSPSTVAVNIDEACVRTESGDIFTNHCEQTQLGTGESSSTSLDYSATTTAVNQSGRECIVNIDENSEDLENEVFEENSDNVESVCRICHCGEDVEALISPCLCIGSMRFVHHVCLMNWLQRSVKARCEICLHSFAVRRKTKAFKKVRF